MLRTPDSECSGPSVSQRLHQQDGHLFEAGQIVMQQVYSISLLGVQTRWEQGVSIH